MTRRQQRMLGVAAVVLSLAVAAALTLTAFRKNLMAFYTPTDLIAAHAPAGSKIRLGGLVERGSVRKGAGLEVEFTLADCVNRVQVRYAGLLPDLFREGQGVVANGHIADGGGFVADEVLAKHDENYMPPQVAKSMQTAQGACAPFKPVTGKAS